MIFALIFSLCCLTAWVSPQYQPQFYSYSPSVGRGIGSSFASTGEGRITGVRVWENSGSYIRGFQLKYEYIWTPVYGRKTTLENELLLFDDEAFVQISGKYNTGNYIYQLLFVTSRGRTLTAGQPLGTSFNFYPDNSQSELRFLSGRTDNNGISSIGAHWARLYRMNGNNTMALL